MKSIVKKLVVGSAFGLVAMLAGEQAEAATSTSPMAVSVTVLSNCNIQAGPLGFPQYDPGLGTTSATTADLVVDCTNGVPFTIAFGAGGGAANAYGNRSMAGPGGASLGYQLSSGAGDLAVGATAFAANGDGYSGGFGISDQTFTINGLIPASQPVAGGAYSDSVVATLSY